MNFLKGKIISSVCIFLQGILDGQEYPLVFEHFPERAFLMIRAEINAVTSYLMFLYLYLFYFVLHFFFNLATNAIVNRAQRVWRRTLTPWLASSDGWRGKAVMLSWTWMTVSVQPCGWTQSQNSSVSCGNVVLNVSWFFILDVIQMVSSETIPSPAYEALFQCNLRMLAGELLSSCIAFPLKKVLWYLCSAEPIFPYCTTSHYTIHNGGVYSSTIKECRNDNDPFVCLT